MTCQTHQEFYDLNGDNAVSDGLAGITHEEYYQHIKARLWSEAVEEALEAFANASSQESSQE